MPALWFYVPWVFVLMLTGCADASRASVTRALPGMDPPPGRSSLRRCDGDATTSMKVSLPAISEWTVSLPSVTATVSVDSSHRCCRLAIPSIAETPSTERTLRPDFDLGSPAASRCSRGAAAPLQGVRDRVHAVKPRYSARRYTGPPLRKSGRRRTVHLEAVAGEASRLRRGCRS